MNIMGTLTTILPNPYLALVLLVLLIIILVGWIVRVELKFSRLLSGKDARSLEDTIVSLAKSRNAFEKRHHEIDQYLRDVERRIQRSVQSVETVRFNPFSGDGSGGKQSFASAFVSEKGNGVVLSSLYARERMSMFAKPLAGFTSPFELSEEERQAVERAREGIMKKEQ